MARGLFVEGSRWIDEALAAAPEPTPERVRALLSTGAIRVRRRHHAQHGGAGPEALEIVRRDGDRHAEARALERLGVMAMGGFDWGVADGALEEGLALAREIGDDVVTVAIKHAQGVLAGCRGRNAVARELLEECLALLAGMPDASRAAVLGDAHLAGGGAAVPGRPDAAPSSRTPSASSATVRSRAAAGYTLVSIGEAWRSDREYGAAREAMEEALGLFRALDDDLGASVTLNALGNLARRPASRRSAGSSSRTRWRCGAPRATRARSPRRCRAWACSRSPPATEESARRLLAAAFDIYERTDDGPGLQGVAAQPRRVRARARRRRARVSSTSSTASRSAPTRGSSATAAGPRWSWPRPRSQPGTSSSPAAPSRTAIELFERGGYTFGPAHARMLEQQLGALAGAD